MEVSRYVNLIYVGTAILTLVIFQKALDWLWTGFDSLRHYALIGDMVTVTSVIALVLTAGLIIYLYRREDIYGFLSEVVIELKKVTWPGWDETKRSTLIVIIFVFVLSGFLWLSDQVWRYVTEFILTPGA